MISTSRAPDKSSASPSAHDPELCGLDAPGYPTLCPGCRTAPRASTPRASTPHEIRRQRAGQRLAALVRRHGDALRPVLVDLLAEDIGTIAAEVLRCP